MSKLKFKVKNVVAAPKFDLPLDRPYYIKFVGAVHLVDKPEVLDAKTGAVKEPASQYPAALVVNLETGETGELGLTAVLFSSLEQKYGANGFEGLCFEVVKSKVEGKRYFSYSCNEIEIEDDEPTAAAEEKPKTKK